MATPGWPVCPVALGNSRTCEDAMRLQRLEYAIQCSSLAILYFDYILTFGDEIAYVWMRKRRVSTILYVCCRYSLVSNIVYILGISEHFNGLKCNTGYRICGSLSVLGHIGIIMVWTLRTCALYGNNLTMFASLGTFGLTVVVILSYRVPFLSCEIGQDISTVAGVNAAIVIFIELVSFSLATWHIRQVLRSQKKAQADNTSSLMRLHRLILAQGVYYIIAVFAFAIAQLVLNFQWKTGFLARLVNAIKLPLSGLLTARFMLHLRKDDHKTVLDQDNHSTRWNSVCDEFSGEITFAHRSDIDEWMDDDDPDHEAEVDETPGPGGTCEAHRIAMQGYSGQEERSAEQNV
ncbi:hypothetical protein BKA70DRAFT_1571856 [Coprinopsis sp. MPI-PUGE-AT-0042]|nr:hypothetical protein BKA70DRAFT_1571856 [Coprinopsis sp. MPI-PUGE-AT-0042]